MVTAATTIVSTGRLCDAARAPTPDGATQIDRPLQLGRLGKPQVTVAFRNPASPEKAWEGWFLLDTGAVDCLAPGHELRAIGLKPTGKRTYELADETPVGFEVAVAQVEFMGETVGVTILFGPDDAEPILGVTALESVGIEVDPRTQRLKRLPTARLKSLRP